MAAERKGITRSRLPPAAALLVISGYLILVPLYQWTRIGLRDWGYGGSPAAELDRPYFWALVLFRTVGAFLLAALLWFVRRPTAVWLAVAATWMAGPPLTFMFVGITLLAASAGQSSVPDDWALLKWAFVFPLLVTIGLLGPSSVRKHYGLSGVPAEKP